MIRLMIDLFIRLIFLLFVFNLYIVSNVGGNFVKIIKGGIING